MSGERSTWAQPGVVRNSVEKAWRAGTVLRALADRRPENPDGDEVDTPAMPGFPIRVRLLGPSGEQVADDFRAATAWADALAADAAEHGWRLERRAVRAGSLGRQRLPAVGFVDTPEQALEMLGRSYRRDAATFRNALRQANDAGPWAVHVALDRPFEVIDAATDWPAVLAVAGWLREHPRPGLHPRALPIDGVHSKLTEVRRRLLTRVLMAALPPEAVDARATTFEERFGLAGAPRQVRLRARGTAIGLAHLNSAEVEWPLAGLAGIDPASHGINEVLVVENLQPFRKVPPTAGRLILWGQGYSAADMLSALPWIGSVAVTYWGDIDTHGLAILDLVRAAAPHARSILMDRSVLRMHLGRAGSEANPRRDHLTRLTDVEAETYRCLCDDELGARLRLEQEHLPWHEVLLTLARSEPVENQIPEPDRSRAFAPEAAEQPESEDDARAHHRNEGSIEAAGHRQP